MWSQDGCGSGPRAFGGRKRVSASVTSINHRPSRAGGQLPRRRQGTPGRPAERGRVPAGIFAPPDSEQLEYRLLPQHAYHRADRFS